MNIPSEQIKAFYKSHGETNWIKRYESPYLLRRYFSRTMWRVVSQPLKDCSRVLDAGCGDAVLSVLMILSNRQLKVVAMDISEENIRRAREAAAAYNVGDRISFVLGDVEQMPFRESSFSGVVVNQVIEHLPNIDRGVGEIRRVLGPGCSAVVGMPACLNPSAMVLLGGDTYWSITKRTPIAFWKGFMKVIRAWWHRQEGVQEGYVGRMELPHIRRFPSRSVRRIENSGLKVVQWMADSLLIPYVAQFFPPFVRLQQWLDDRLRARRFWRNFGLGVIIVARKDM